ncbi:MAG: methyltransferase family protein [Parcubacteria group bacterium Greene0416_79]|nr:MAG: methyltransferase family protein [Parcubacteria group bacterium Greene0416_79]
MNLVVTRVTVQRQCRICGNGRLIPILDLGAQPPANGFLTARQLKRPEARFPLVVQFCESCSLLSLRHTVDSRVLFKNYRYETGASAPLVAHFAEEARMIERQFIRNKSDLVVEFGSNDGALLSALKGTCRVLGVDPAKSVATLAKKRGVLTVTAFFGEKSAERIRKRYGQARVIIANNVFAHIDDVHDVMRGITALLRPDGVFISESHWVGNLIGEGGFDQIYHEHLSYYSLHALRCLAHEHGLVVTKVELVPIHGECLRVSMRKQGVSGASVKRLLRREKSLGLTQLSIFLTFARKADKTRMTLRQLINKLIRKKNTIAGYGAPAKGNTLLNYLQIGKRDIALLMIFYAEEIAFLDSANMNTHSKHSLKTLSHATRSYDDRYCFLLPKPVHA